MRYLFAFLFFPVFLSAQDDDILVVRIAHSCSYEGEERASDYYTFKPSTEADRIVQEICDAKGLAKNFVVRSANVSNAVATMDADGRRVILYSTLFLEKFKSDTRTRWAAYSVLAHEIGHHLNGHRFDEQDPVRRKAMELEADKFSGSALRMLNAGLEDSKAGIEQFAREGETAKYPPGSARREAVASGWKKQDEHLRTIIGITTTTTNPGSAPAPDRDGDGTPDATDKCPDTYGLATLGGCPDADGDGIPDSEDKCKYQRGEARWKGCPDTDGDSLPDHEDDCPTVAGLTSLRGCPLADRDNDGVPDASDQCPNETGMRQYQGCPDTDGDGVPDPDDYCPTQKGLPALQGCPEKNKPTTKPSPVSSGAGARDLAADGLVFVQGGPFTMGCTAEQGSDCDTDEKPTRKVTLSDYYIGKYEVTQKQWRNVMGSNPPELGFPGCDDCPVENVSWNDVQDFLKKLNSANPGKNYRLPTEAEWEYAARGGNLTENYKYAGSNTIDDVAWYSPNAGFKTHPVGGKNANELGLHDMSGNVWEWCSDWIGTYPSGAETNPTGSSLGDTRVHRGGSLSRDALLCRVAYRTSALPASRHFTLGFRICRSR